MKDGNMQESGWNGSEYEWKGNRRVEAGAPRNGRAVLQRGGPQPKEGQESGRSPYEEYDWQDDADEEYAAPEEENDGAKKKRSAVSLLTAIQIIGCCAVLAAVVVLKLMGNSIYGSFRSWYLAAANDSVIAQEQMDQARRSVIGFWTTISSAGPQQPAASASSGAPASSQAASSAAGSSQSGSSPAQSGAASAASGAAEKGAASSP